MHSGNGLQISECSHCSTPTTNTVVRSGFQSNFVLAFAELVQNSAATAKTRAIRQTRSIRGIQRVQSEANKSMLNSSSFPRHAENAKNAGNWPHSAGSDTLWVAHV